MAKTLLENLMKLEWVAGLLEVLDGYEDYLALKAVR